MGHPSHNAGQGRVRKHVLELNRQLGAPDLLDGLGGRAATVSATAGCRRRRRRRRRRDGGVLGDVAEIAVHIPGTLAGYAGCSGRAAQAGAVVPLLPQADVLGGANAGAAAAPTADPALVIYYYRLACMRSSSRITGGLHPSGGGGGELLLLPQVHLLLLPDDGLLGRSHGRYHANAGRVGGCGAGVGRDNVCVRGAGGRRGGGTRSVPVTAHFTYGGHHGIRADGIGIRLVLVRMKGKWEYFRVTSACFLPAARLTSFFSHTSKHPGRIRPVSSLDLCAAGRTHPCRRHLLL